MKRSPWCFAWAPTRSKSKLSLPKGTTSGNNFAGAATASPLTSHSKVSLNLHDGSMCSIVIPGHQAMSSHSMKGSGNEVGTEHTLHLFVLGAVGSFHTLG